MEQQNLPSNDQKIAVFDPLMSCPNHQIPHDPRDIENHDYEYLVGPDGIPIIRCCAQQYDTQLRFQELKKELLKYGGDINLMIKTVTQDPTRRAATKDPQIAELNLWKSQLKWKLVQWFQFSKEKCQDKLILDQQTFVCANKMLTLPLAPEKLIQTPPRLIFQSKNQAVIKAKMFPQNLLLPKGLTNNFKQTIETDFGIGSYSETYHFSSQLPKKIQVINMSKASTKKSIQIEKTMRNHQRLPLEIRQSKVPVAGRGVFTTKKIPDDTLLMMYVGQQINSLQNWPPSDSVYDLGFISQAITPQNENLRSIQRLVPWVIDPVRKLNAGRYINSFQQTNLRMEKVSFKMGKSCTSQIIGLALITTQQIPAGQQLSYSYGSNYGFDDGFAKFNDWRGGYFSRYMAGVKGDPAIPLIVRKWRKLIKRSDQLYESSSEEEDQSSSHEDNQGCEDETLHSTIASVMEQIISNVEKVVRNPLTQKEKQFDRVLSFDQKPDMHVRQKLAKVYRQFSRQRYNKYLHQFPRMRESQRVTKIVKEWQSMSMTEKLQFHQHALDINSYADESQSSSQCQKVQKPSPRHPTKHMHKQQKLANKQTVRCFIYESDEQKANDSDFERQGNRQFVIDESLSISQQIGQPSSPKRQRTAPKLVRPRQRKEKKEKTVTIQRPVDVRDIPFREFIPYIEKLAASPGNCLGIYLREDTVAKQIDNIYFFTGQSLNRKAQFGIGSYYQCRICQKQVIESWKMRHLRQSHRPWVVSYEVKKHMAERKRFWVLAEAPKDHCNDIQSWTLIDDSPSYRWKNAHVARLRQQDCPSYIKKGMIQILLEVDYIERDSLKHPFCVANSEVGTKAQRCSLKAITPQQSFKQIQQLISNSPFSWHQVWETFSKMTNGSTRITKQNGVTTNIYEMIHAFYRKAHQVYRVYNDSRYITISSKALVDQQKNMKSRGEKLVANNIKTQKAKIKVIAKKSHIEREKSVQNKPLFDSAYLPTQHLVESVMEYYNCPNCQIVLPISNVAHVSYCVKYVRPCSECGVLIDKMQLHQCAKNRNSIQLAHQVISVQKNIEQCLMKKDRIKRYDGSQRNATGNMENVEKQIIESQKVDGGDQELLPILDPNISNQPINVLSTKLTIAQPQQKKRIRRNHTQYMQYHRNRYRGYFNETIKRLRDPVIRDKLFESRGWTKHEINLKIQLLDTELQRLDAIQGTNLCQICLSYISPHIQAGNHRLLELSIENPNHILVLESIRKAEELNAFGVSPFCLFTNNALVRECRQCRKCFHSICWVQNYNQSDWGSQRCPNCRGENTIIEPDRVIFSGTEDIFIGQKPVYGFHSIMDAVGVKI